KRQVQDWSTTLTGSGSGTADASARHGIHAQRVRAHRVRTERGRADHVLAVGGQRVENHRVRALVALVVVARKLLERAVDYPSDHEVGVELGRPHTDADGLAGSPTIEPRLERAAFGVDVAFTERARD